ncbi:MAG TPA: sulfite exporter TauE/SafE family protein [Burkholderiaceae bacterium]
MTTTPDELSATLFAAMALVFLLAGVVKGVVGLGLPTLAMALLALLMSPARAAALLIVPSLVTNLWQLRPWASLGRMARRLWPLQFGICTGTLAGAWVLGAPSSSWAMAALGAMLIVYALWALSGARLSIAQDMETELGLPMGAMTGLIAAVTGVFTVPAVPYLQALSLNRDELIQAMGISFTVSTVALGLSLFLNGHYSSADASASALMLLPALLGMSVGRSLRHRLSPLVFRRCFLGGLVALGLHMIIQQAASMR